MDRSTRVVPRPARAPTERSAGLAIVVPAVSLVAAADMMAPGPGVLPDAAWAALLLAFAAVAAAVGRSRRCAHLAVEPLGMAFMFVLAALHRHAPAAVAVSGASGAHAHGGGWVEPALAAAVVTLSAACLASAGRSGWLLRAGAHGGAARTAAAALAGVSAVAMCAMTAHLLLG